MTEKKETPKKNKKDLTSLTNKKSSIKEQIKERLTDIKTSKKETTKEKVELEREYIIPLRKKFLKVQRYKRATKAIKIIREFLAKHMKVENRDTKKIKINKWLNNEIWFRGIKKPPVKIKVKATKMSNGIVNVELANIPKIVEYAMKKEEKRISKINKTDLKKPTENKTAETETKEEAKNSQEKIKANEESNIQKQKTKATQAKHTAQGKHQKITTPIRKTLKK